MISTQHPYGPYDCKCDCGCGWVASQGRDADDMEGTARRLGALLWAAAAAPAVLLLFVVVVKAAWEALS